MVSYDRMTVVVVDGTGAALPLYQLPQNLDERISKELRVNTAYLEAEPHSIYAMRFGLSPKWNFKRYKAIAFDVSIEGRAGFRAVIDGDAPTSDGDMHAIEYSQRRVAEDGSIEPLRFPDTSSHTSVIRFDKQGGQFTKVATITVTVLAGCREDDGSFRQQSQVPFATFHFLLRSPRQIEPMGLEPIVQHSTRIGTALMGNPANQKRIGEASTTISTGSEALVNPGSGAGGALVKDKDGSTSRKRKMAPTNARPAEQVKIVRNSRVGDREDEDLAIIDIESGPFEVVKGRKDLREPRGKLHSIQKRAVPKTPLSGSPRQERRTSRITPRNTAIADSMRIKVEPQDDFDMRRVPQHPEESNISQEEKRKSVFDLLDQMQHRIPSMSGLDAEDLGAIQRNFEHRQLVLEATKVLGDYFKAEDAAKEPVVYNNLIDLTQDSDDEL